MAAIGLSAILFHLGRKCMYPQLSIEAHCMAALKERNTASALIVAAFLLHQIAMSWLLVLCLVAMVAK